MKRRDFVKIAALLPVAPAMVVASQLKPAQIPTCPAKQAGQYGEWVADDDCNTGFTFTEDGLRANGFWVTFDDIEKQTNFLRGHLGNKEDFWHINDNYYKDINTVYSVETVCAGKDSEEMTRVSFGSVLFYIGTGAKISINVADPSIRIKHISWSGAALDWKWTRETYKDTVIRVATEFDAFNPEWLLSFARAEKVSQTRIKSWMWEKKYGPDKLVLRSHFKADVVSGIGGARS